MSMSERMPQTTWQRWEMARFDAPVLVQHEDVRADMQVQADLEIMQREAQMQGHAQGYAEGHAQGLSQGMREGHAEGLRQGQEEGLQQGFASGLTSGLQDGRAQAQQQSEQLQQLVQACAHALSTLEEDISQALLHLAVRIAECMVHQTLSTQPDHLLPIVRDIVQMHGDSDAVLTLRLHPQDYDVVQQYLQQDGALRRWRLRADASVQAGGCCAETALGTVDATWQTRWNKVLGALGLNNLQDAHALAAKPGMQSFA